MWSSGAKISFIPIPYAIIRVLLVSKDRTVRPDRTEHTHLSLHLDLD